MRKVQGMTMGSILILMLAGCGSDPTMSTELNQITVENALLVPADLPEMKLVTTYAVGQKIPPVSDSFDPESFENMDFRKCTDVYSPLYLSPNKVPTTETWAWTVMYDESKESEPVLISEFLRVADSKYGEIVKEVATNQSVCKELTFDGTPVKVKSLDIGKFGDFTLAYNLSPDFEEYADSEPNYTVVVIGYGSNYLTALLDLNKGFSVSKVASIAELMDSKFKKISSLQK